MKKWIVFIAALSLLLVAPVMAQAPEGRESTVKVGDELNKIAAKYLGDPTKYPEIVDATNLKAKEDSSYTPITDPHVIEVGQKLWIPEEAGEGPEPTAAPTWEPTEEQPQRIQVAAGATTAQVKGTLPSGGIAHYVLAAQGGQTMSLKVTPGDLPPQSSGLFLGAPDLIQKSQHLTVHFIHGSIEMGSRGS